MEPISIKKIVAGIFVLILLVLAYSSVFVVDEGYQGIVLRFGQAINQAGPGLHTKIPMAEEIVPMEVRVRKLSVSTQASTNEQMPVTAKVSLNWMIQKTSALKVFSEYGSMDQFETRILMPKLLAVAKIELSKYSAEDMLSKERSKAALGIQEDLRDEMKAFPIDPSSIQISLEDIGLPPAYVQSIQAKQTAKNKRDAEQFNLDRQGLEAQQAVNTAKANKEAAILKADGDYYSAQKQAQANKDLIQSVGSIDGLVKLTYARAWKGVLPQVQTGGGAIVQIPPLNKDSK